MSPFPPSYPPFDTLVCALLPPFKRYHFQRVARRFDVKIASDVEATVASATFAAACARNKNDVAVATHKADLFIYDTCSALVFALRRVHEREFS